MADGDDANQKRKFFRIEYPKSERPTFCCAGTNYAILDVSEEGIRFELSPMHDLIAGERLVGSIDLFPFNFNIEICGDSLNFRNLRRIKINERWIPPVFEVTYYEPVCRIGVHGEYFTE